MHDLPTTYQQVIHRSKYSRWRDDLGRREHWPETANRYINFFRDRHPDLFKPRYWDQLEKSIVVLDDLPSMRALMTAGRALEKDHVAGYNCAYLTVSRPEAWDEMMYILMCGTGVGYSVEEKYVSQLPTVPSELAPAECPPIKVRDSKYGWAEATRKIIKGLYDGVIYDWDLSGIRPEGAVLKTFGGRASGPDPLARFLHHVVKTFYIARGRKLTSIEAHGISTMIGDIVVVGGVRRSAMIALFSEGDHRMLTAKTGEWFNNNPHYGMANNTQVFDSQPSAGEFMKTFGVLADSGSGEPGIMNRAALRAQASRFGRRAPDLDYGMNPCGEIILRDRQFCNLSSAIARPGDTLDDLKRKQTHATHFGVMQSVLTDFKHLTAKWKENCDEERLLGVNITGIPDHPVLNMSQGYDDLKKWANALRDNARRVAEGDAKKIGITVPAAIGTLKPDGNTSQLTAAASPLKPWHAKHFIRRIRGNKTDPVSRMMVDQDVVHEDESWHPDTTWVFSFPQAAPEGAATRHDWTAVDQLKLWLAWHEEYCEHKPSVTINVKPHEWLGVAQFVWENFDKASGIAFLPDEDHTYVQAPYEECTREEYDELMKLTPPDLDWNFLQLYEESDRTTGSQELACIGSSCEVQ